ncbi:ATP-binding cassette domain-containing protein [Cysteiniphilum sp. 6C5]|uniref:ATP-binding cassette domain-containing protein n=1 Tax=unclassified Cysteiniphilum TaxID=2610889 RepID=UPI003F8463C5
MCNGLKLENVSFAYHRKQSILKDVSLTLNSGKITALVGENGCGKTTLIKLITGVLPPQSGGIFYDGQCLTEV